MGGILMTGTKGAYLDGFRVVSALLVVAIHTSPLGSLSTDADWFLTRVIARIAVPFFFLSTGYFSREILENGKLGKRLQKLCLLYLASIVLYLPLNIYMGDFHRISIGTCLRKLLLDGTFYHLWYFPAVIIGLILLRAAVRILGWKYAGVLAGVFYCIGLGGDSWYGLLENISGIKQIYKFLFTFMDYTRNGLFFAPFYLWLGGSLAKWEADKAACTVGLLLSVCLMFTEAILLRHLGICRFDSMYLFLVPVSVFSFALLSAKEQKSRRTYRVFSLMVYVLHPWCIVALRFAARMLGLWSLLVENRLSAFFAVCLMSGLISAMGTAIWVKIRSRRCLHKVQCENRVPVESSPLQLP